MRKTLEEILNKEETGLRPPLSGSHEVHDFIKSRIWTDMVSWLSFELYGAEARLKAEDADTIQKVNRLRERIRVLEELLTLPDVLLETVKETEREKKDA